MSDQKGFRLTPLWLVTIVFCGLTMFLVLRDPDSIRKLSFGDNSVELGRESIAGEPSQEDVQAGEEKLLAQLAQMREELRKSSRANSGTTPTLESSVANLSGLWRAQGMPSQYIFERSGAGYTIVEQSAMWPGVPTAIASATFDGKVVQLSYQGTLGNTGTGRLECTASQDTSCAQLRGWLEDHVGGLRSSVVWIR